MSQTKGRGVLERGKVNTKTDFKTEGLIHDIECGKREREGLESFYGK